MRVDPSLVVPDERRSLLDGAISVSGWQSDSNNTMARMYFTALSKEYDFRLIRRGWSFRMRLSASCYMERGNASCTYSISATMGAVNLTPRLRA